MNKSEVLTITDDLNNSFLFMYGGADLYWTVTDYDKNNIFIFNKENPIYSYLDNLFIKFNNNGLIEWVSEAYGTSEESHKLVIEKIDNYYKLSFIQNELNMYRLKDLCPICFCLSGSNNPKFVMEISNMYYQMQSRKKDGQKRALNKCSI